ncbi:hypothetical protein A3J91_03400 [Candidatus Peribacteria bacterium RIFOXYC2_FULL_58_10]|nr:MAG: hypothetical protein A3J91_03400 [Candidatus Peribacteria bacterium RIFOXYC2_FULL_58_10]
MTFPIRTMPDPDRNVPTIAELYALGATAIGRNPDMDDEYRLRAGELAESLGDLEQRKHELNPSEVKMRLLTIRDALRTLIAQSDAVLAEERKWQTQITGAENN